MLYLIIIGYALFGSSPGAKNAQGNDLYQQGKFEEAAKAYQTAQADAPNNAALQYNLGNALYRQQKFPEAAQAYRQAAAGKDSLAAHAYYNMGNSLYRAGQIDGAIDAYKKGLRINSNDIDMKYNLEFVQRQQQEQKKQNESDKDKDQQKDKQDQKKQDQDQKKQDQDQKKQDQASSDQEKETDQAKEQPQSGQLSREQAERLLNALNGNEQDIQKQLRKQGAVGQKNPDRDW